VFDGHSLLYRELNPVSERTNECFGLHPPSAFLESLKNLKTLKNHCVSEDVTPFVFREKGEDTCSVRLGIAQSTYNFTCGSVWV
jgi:hypothetical protein